MTHDEETKSWQLLFAEHKSVTAERDALRAQIAALIQTAEQVKRRELAELEMAVDTAKRNYLAACEKTEQLRKTWHTTADSFIAARDAAKVGA